jgi:hypothetical protein
VRLLQGDPGCAIEPPDRKSQVLWSKWFSRGSFSNTPTRCSVKCLRGYKLFFESISCVVLLAPFRASATVPSPVLRADNFAIAVRSWPS